MDKIPIESISQLISLSHLLEAAFIFILAWILMKAFKVFSEFLAQRFARYRVKITGSFPIIRLLIWTAAIFAVIVLVIRPPQATLLAIVASAGFALGLSAQDLLKNVLSGILIVFDQPFRIGDMVKIGQHYGEVIAIDLNSVKLRTFDDTVVTVPNSTVMTQAVANSNAGELDEMVVIEFSLPASIEVDRVKSLAWEAAASCPYVFLQKPILVTVEDRFDRTFLTRFKVKCYVLDARYERILASDIMERIKTALIEKRLMSESVVMGILAASSDPGAKAISPASS